MKTKYIFLTLLAFVSLAFLSSCKKYLDKAPDDRLLTPSSLEDLQLILDEYEGWNAVSYPYGSELLTDDFYLTPADYNAVTNQLQRDVYLFKITTATSALWNPSYARIYQANVVLFELNRLGKGTTNSDQFNAIKGSALFYRGFYLAGLLPLFTLPYDKTTAANDLGLPIRNSPDYEDQSVRSSLQQTYDQVLADYKSAAAMLPVTVPYKTRPSKAAAYGAIARTYLNMQQYDSAGKYADLCISTYGPDNLLNFNSDISAASNNPFPRFNKEVIFHIRSQAITLMTNARARVDTFLYASYHTDDMRKRAYFRLNTNGSYQFKGDYDGSGTATGYVYAGIVMDEMYLIRAESYARTGDKDKALSDLNKLMQTRWTTGRFSPFTAANAQAALAHVLAERRKELVRRGIRWTDIRRYRSDPSNAVILKRSLSGTDYTLPLVSPRFALLIPAEVINLSGMPQNAQ